MSFVELLEMYYIKNVEMKQLKSHVRCYFCQRASECYYSNDLCYKGFVDSYRYYLCKDSYNDLISFPNKMLLLNNLKRDLCFDVLSVIYAYFKDIAPCIKIVENEKINRHLYLNTDLTKLTINQLKELMNQNDMYIVKNQRKIYYIQQLKNDFLNKRFIWKNDEIGL